MGFCKTIKTVCRKKRSRRSLARLLLTHILCTIFFLGIPALCAAPADKVFIYFYSSETNINNFKSLKMGFDKYLAEYGPYEFQPFEDRETFEEHIKDKEKCLLLLSSWHFKNIYNDYGLRFALTGLRNGKKYQQRILVALDTVLSTDDVVGTSIASASSVEHTKSAVAGMFEEEDTAAKTSILSVSKDLDALMCVGFGMSTAALTTRNSFEELKKINPLLHGKMKILAEGLESLSLIMAVPAGFTEQAVQPINVIKSMTMNPDGMKKMQMLGLDGWQEPDLSDRQILETR